MSKVQKDNMQEDEVEQVRTRLERKQSKFSLFIENFVVYGIGGVISKVIPLIMVPIVTRLMPDSSYYGISGLLVAHLLLWACMMPCIGCFLKRMMKTIRKKYALQQCL